MDTIFQIISRFTIVIPVAAIIGAIFLKTNSNNSSLKNLTSTPSPTRETKQILPTNIIHPSTSVNLNLNGPFFCNFVNSGITFSVYIKDKKIALKLEEKSKVQNFLVRDDCLNIWDSGNFSGDKVCGIGRYIQIADSLLSTNLLDFNSILGSLSQFGSIPKSISSAENLKNLADSCRKEEIKNESVFNVPQNVLFKNKEPFKVVK